MTTDARPDILLVICHDLGRHLGCYGAGVHTPNLDRLAAEGVRFTQNFCTTPLCSPSRGSIQTGRYPHRTGLMGLVNRGWALPADEPTLPERLRAAGYRSWLFGLQHERRERTSMGYDTVVGTGPAHAEAVLPHLEAFLREPPDGPFLAVVGLTETHRPFRNPRYTPDDPQTVRVPGYLPDRPEVRQDIADLQGLVKVVDGFMGQTLAALEAGGRARNTLVIFTADHGIAFPRAKSTLYDSGIGTALLIRWPAACPPGRTSHAMISNIDLMPTLVAAAGQPVPADIDGRSILDLLRGGPDHAREAIFAEKNYHDAYDPMRAVRTDRFKLIRRWGDGPDLVLPKDIAPCPSATAPEIAAATQRPRRTIELYDVADDPWECQDRAGDASLAAVRAELEARLRRWMEETGDPLLRGPVAAPAGSVDAHETAGV